jgi:hypothetical protein
MTPEEQLAQIEAQMAQQDAQAAQIQAQADQLSPHYQAAQEAASYLPNPSAQAGQSVSIPQPVYVASTPPQPPSVLPLRFLTGAAVVGFALFVMSELKQSVRK